jgi:hypothetical protein
MIDTRCIECDALVSLRALFEQEFGIPQEGDAVEHRELGFLLMYRAVGSICYKLLRSTKVFMPPTIDRQTLPLCMQARAAAPSSFPWSLVAAFFDPYRAFYARQPHLYHLDRRAVTVFGDDPPDKSTSSQSDFV